MGAEAVIEKIMARATAEAEKILSDQAANVYLMDPNELTVISNKLDGYVSYPMFVIDLSKIYFK